MGRKKQRRVKLAPKPRGRPSAFREEYVNQAFALALLGLTDKEMAGVFGVSEVTFNAWKVAHPEFLKSLNDGKPIADARVSKALYERALGYSHEAVKIFNSEGAALEVPYTEHYPPDPTACIFWLKNRQPGLWRDKPDLVVNVQQTNNTLAIPAEVLARAKELAERP